MTKQTLDQRINRGIRRQKEVVQKKAEQTKRIIELFLASLGVRRR